MVANGGGLEFLRLVEDGQIGGELFGAVNLEEEAEGLQIIAFEERVLGIGLVGEQLEKDYEVLLDVVHDFSLLVADVEGAGGSIARRGEIAACQLLPWGVNVAGALVEDDLALATHQLQHEYQEEHLCVHLSVLSLHNPPKLLVVAIEKLLHQVLVLGQTKL